MDRCQYPAAASRVGQRILDAVRQLEDFPLRGRPGRSPGTRELVISRLPYLVVYSVDAADPRGRDPPGAAWGHVVATGRTLNVLDAEVG